MALRDQSEIARDDRFMRRVQIAMCAAAIGVHGEPPDSSNHAIRAEYARTVLNDPERYMPIFTVAICAFDGNLNTASTDQTISHAILGVWNALAGTPGAKASRKATHDGNDRQSLPETQAPDADGHAAAGPRGGRIPV